MFKFIRFAWIYTRAKLTARRELAIEPIKYNCNGLTYMFCPETVGNPVVSTKIKEAIDALTGVFKREECTSESFEDLGVLEWRGFELNLSKEKFTNYELAVALIFIPRLRGII